MFCHYSGTNVSNCCLQTFFRVQVNHRMQVECVKLEIAQPTELEGMYNAGENFHYSVKF